MSFYTVKQMALRYPAFTEKALWALIADRENNGFDKCTTLIGKNSTKRIVFDDEFQNYVRERHLKPQSKTTETKNSKTKSQWEIETDKVINASRSKIVSKFQVIRDTDVLEWNCEKGHVFPYTQLEIEKKGITCPHC